MASCDWKMVGRSAMILIISPVYNRPYLASTFFYLATIWSILISIREGSVVTMDKKLKGAAVTQRLMCPYWSHVQDSLRAGFFIISLWLPSRKGTMILFRAGISGVGIEEEWCPTSITSLPVQVGSNSHFPHTDSH